MTKTFDYFKIIGKYILKILDCIFFIFKFSHFNNIFNSMIGAEFRRFVKLTFESIDGKVVCLANVGSSHKPVYLKTGVGEDFYIRTGNVSTPLKMSEAATYISSWWQ